MREELDAKLALFESLERKMCDPAILADSHSLAAVAREHGTLSRVAIRVRAFGLVERQIAEIVDMAAESDPELRDLVEGELASLRAIRETQWDELADMMSEDDDAERSRCIVELRAGTGGDEAALFVRDLYEMYRRFIAESGWNSEILDASPTELGGFKEIVLGVVGESAYRKLRFESGGHRVQRVPNTETKGRIHTSAATVARVWAWPSPSGSA